MSEELFDDLLNIVDERVSSWCYDHNYSDENISKVCEESLNYIKEEGEDVYDDGLNSLVSYLIGEYAMADDEDEE
ncbi:MAG: hypothetical protein LBT91_02635 [Bifidobacteriaceae bacterium]|jgi:hypothetical protein|nr:hypothetical protein [Bifidobacteriaceae bacterium]